MVYWIPKKERKKKLQEPHSVSAILLVIDSSAFLNKKKKKGNGPLPIRDVLMKHWILSENSLAKLCPVKVHVAILRIAK